MHEETKNSGKLLGQDTFHPLGVIRWGELWFVVRQARKDSVDIRAELILLETPPASARLSRFD
jgi:hypothetical protein